LSVNYVLLSVLEHSWL